MGSIIGIDLGTTSSAAAVWDGSSARLIPDASGRTILPSLVVIRKDRRFFVGHEAISESRKYSGENLTIGSLKRMMDRQKEFCWGQVRTSPQILSALILAELKVQAEMYLGEAVTQAVIGVPANFGLYERQFTKEAARIAGLEALWILNEATAAVCTLTDKREKGVSPRPVAFSRSPILQNEGVIPAQSHFIERGPVKPDTRSSPPPSKIIKLSLAEFHIPV